MGEQTSKATSGANKTILRQTILVGVLVLLAAAFLYDKYVLAPRNHEKIDQIVEQVTLKLNPENRKQVHEIVGFKPASTFTYKGLEVEQYRFPRSLPFFPGLILDIAYDGDTIAFYREEAPIDNNYIDAQKKPTEIDHSLDAEFGDIIASQ